MLICCCGLHNTPGDQECPGGCEAALRNRVTCEEIGHLTTSNINRQKAGLERLLGPVPRGDVCNACGERGPDVDE